MSVKDAVYSAIKMRTDYGRLLSESAEPLVTITEMVTRAIRDGQKIMTCGNGGSAAESMHLAEELIGRFRADRRPLPALSLAADSTALTCIANDYGFEHVFARQVEALGHKGDVLIALSTSGKSPNIISALKCGQGRGVKTIGLLGRSGSPAEAHCDVVFTPATDEPALVQELHLAVIHIVLDAVDREFATR